MYKLVLTVYRKQIVFAKLFIGNSDKEEEIADVLYDVLRVDLDYDYLGRDTYIQKYFNCPIDDYIAVTKGAIISNSTLCNIINVVLVEQDCPALNLIGF